MKPALILLSILCLSLAIRLAQISHASNDAYWRGWHDGKAAQFEADQVQETDGESE